MIKREEKQDYTFIISQLLYDNFDSEKKIEDFKKKKPKLKERLE